MHAHNFLFDAPWWYVSDHVNVIGLALINVIFITVFEYLRMYKYYCTVLRIQIGNHPTLILTGNVIVSGLLL